MQAQVRSTDVKWCSAKLTSSVGAGLGYVHVNPLVALVVASSV